MNHARSVPMERLEDCLILVLPTMCSDGTQKGTTLEKEWSCIFDHEVELMADVPEGHIVGRFELTNVTPRSIGTFRARIVDLKLAVSFSFFPGQLWLQKKHNDSTFFIFLISRCKTN